MEIVVQRPTLPIPLEGLMESPNLVKQHWWIGRSSDTIDWRSHLPKDVKSAPVWRGSSKPSSSWVDRPVVLDDVMDLALYFDLPKMKMRELFYMEAFLELPPRFFALWRRHIERTESLPRFEFIKNSRMADWIDPEYVI